MTIYNPDGSEVSEIVLPDGSTASEVIAPDGSVVFSAIPDSEDLHARYDATKLSLSDGDPVSTWADETGNGYDLTAGIQPTYVANGINSNAAIEFNGTDDYLDTMFSALSQPNTVFAVFEFQSVDDNANEAMIDSADTNNRHAHVANNFGRWAMFGGEVLDTGTADTDAHIWSALWDTTSSVLRLDGGATEATGDAGSQSLNGLRVGSAPGGQEWANVRLGEILIYPEDKSGIQTDVEGYLSDKWGIGV